MSGPSPQTSNSTARPWIALLALATVTLIWGATFSWMKQAQTAAETVLGAGHGTESIALYLSVRFGLAALVMLVLPRVRRSSSRAVWKGGLVLGALLFVGFLLQMSGLEQISPAVSAFLTSLYVLFTAAITAVAARRKPGPALLVGAVAATIGAGVIRGRPELSFRAGELLTVASAFFFAIHILATDRITRAVDALAVTFTTFAWVALFSVLTFFFLHASEASASASALVELVSTRAWLEPVLLTTLLATVIALTLMNLYQRAIDPVRAAILYALEPIWAVIFGVALGLDTLSSWLWIGGALLLFGNLVAELGHRPSTRDAEALGSTPAGS